MNTCTILILLLYCYLNSIYTNTNKLNLELKFSDFNGLDEARKTTADAENFVQITELLKNED